MAERFDVIVIGNGSAGDYIARNLGRRGKKVATVEREHLGGECLNDGCIPSKALIEIANRHIGNPLPWDEVRQRIEAAQARIRGADDGGGFAADGVELVWGEAEFETPTRIRVGSRELEAKDVVLATGTAPSMPPIPGLLEVQPRTNRDIFTMPELPARLAVIGGGPIGLELGQAFARCGSEVTIFDSGERIASTEEPEVSSELHELLVREGIRVEENARIARVSKAADGTGIEWAGGLATVEEILVAAGREAIVPPSLRVLGIDVTGDGFAGIDGCGRTNLKGLWAAGDATGKFLFTHYATYQAHHISRHIERGGCEAIPDAVMSWAIFTSPEIGHAGMTEEQANKTFGDDVAVATIRADELDWFRAVDKADGLAKVICQLSTGRLLGAHFLCDRASSVAGEAALAIQHNLTARQVASTIHAYPTANEIFRWCCARLA